MTLMEMKKQDELKRDAVGNDVYGTARQLYTGQQSHFTGIPVLILLRPRSENLFIKWGTGRLLNLVNSNIIGIPCFTISENVRMNFGMGHVVMPVW